MDRRRRPRRQPRHRRARTAAIPDHGDVQQPDAPARGADAVLRHRLADQGIAIRLGGLSPGAQQRGPDRPSSTAATAGASPARRNCRRSISRPAASTARPALPYPVIRSRERNLTLTALGFVGENYNFWNLTADRSAGGRPPARACGSAPRATSPTGSAASTSSASPSARASTGFGSTDNGNPLASRLGGRVDFSKVEALASRLQPLPERFSFFVSGYAQYAFDPLLVPEQCSFGGRVFGRAYDPSELLGDHCWMASAELRYDLPLSRRAAANRIRVNAFANRADLRLYGQGRARIGRRLCGDSSLDGYGSLGRWRVPAWVVGSVQRRSFGRESN